MTCPGSFSEENRTCDSCFNGIDCEREDKAVIELKGEILPINWTAPCLDCGREIHAGESFMGSEEGYRCSMCMMVHAFKEGPF
jgi:hypothetical protein